MNRHPAHGRVQTRLAYRLLAILTCALVFNPSRAQIPYAAGGGGEDSARRMAVDSEGNVYVSGWFSGVTDFDPGVGERTLTSSGGTDGFLAGFDSDGLLEWVFSVGGSGDDKILDVVSGVDGDLYVTGTVDGQADLDPGSGSQLFSSLESDVFIGKYTGSGSLIWAFGLTGPGHDGPQGMAIDSDDNVYVAGIINDSTDFDPGPGTYFLNAPSGRDIFIAKYSSTGALVWAHNMGGVGDDSGRSVAITADSIMCLIADFHSTFDLDPSTGTHILTNDGTLDALVAGFGLDGALLWAYDISSTQYSQFSDVRGDNFGNCYVTGWFSGAADFEPGGGTTYLTSNGDWDVVTAKYDVHGELAWARSVGAAGRDRANTIHLDTGGNVSTIGSFSLAPDFDPNAGAFVLSSAGGTDAFVTVLDSVGNFIEAFRFGGPLDDNGRGMVATPTLGALLSGSFSDEVTVGSETVVSNGDTDIFLARITDLIPRTVVVDVSLFLEGPYVAGAMWPGVLHLSHVPLTQPFGDGIFDGSSLAYQGDESMLAVSDSLIDWVQIGLRTAASGEEDVARRAALLFRNGTVRDLDGQSPVRFDNIERHGYYVVVRHRNHTSVMSSDTLATSSGFGTWDFRKSPVVAFTLGPSPMRNLGGGNHGLFACDVNFDGIVTAPDFNVWNAQTTAGLTGYVQSDCNLDGQSTAVDFNFWNSNTIAGASSQVPE